MIRGKRIVLAAFAIANLAAWAGNAVAQEGSPDPAEMRRVMEERDKAPNTPGDGPYPSVLGTDPGLPGHVVYRPADLAPFAGNRLPVVIWGNGACADDGTAHRFHLAQIASYGYLVVAAGHWRSGPGATEEPRSIERPADGGLPPPATTAEDVLDGLDWAVAENGRKGSTLHNLIDTDKVAVAGHSCGGLQAIELADDPRIKTVLIHNSGIFNSGVSTIPGVRASKEMLRDFHQPVIYILGGPDDIAYPNGTDDFTRIDQVPAVLASLPVGHGGTFGQPMGGAVAHVAVDWLEWQLKGDEAAGRTFMGENCRLCSGTEWSIERKGW